MAKPTNRNELTEKFALWLIEVIDSLNDKNRIVSVSEPCDDYETINVVDSFGNELRISIEDISLPHPKKPL